MSRFNTGNPIGSADPRDRDDNSKNLDEAVNDLNGETWVDRFGVERITIQGALNRFNEIIISGGQIFESEEAGRDAVQDDQYYYSVSDDPDVSKVLWRRVDADNSEFIADEPSLEFVRSTRGVADLAAEFAVQPSPLPADFYPQPDTGDHPIIVDENGNGVLTIDKDGFLIPHIGAEFYNDDGFEWDYALVNDQGDVVYAVADGRVIDEWLFEFYNGDEATGELLFLGSDGGVLLEWDETGELLQDKAVGGDEQYLIPVLGSSLIYGVGDSKEPLADITEVGVEAVSAGNDRHVRAVVEIPMIGNVRSVAAGGGWLIPDHNRTLHVLIAIGQSLAVGANSAPTLVSIEPVYPEDALMFNAGENSDVRMGLETQGDQPVLDPDSLTGFLPLSAKVGQGSGARGQTIMESYANSLSGEAGRLGAQFRSLSFTAGQGATDYQGLKKGSQVYENMLEAVARAVELAHTEGWTLVVDACLLKHGEGDNSNVNYFNDLMEWQSDIDTDIKSITGQMGNVPFIMNQPSSFYSLHESTMAMQRANAESPNHHLAGADYPFLDEYYTDLLHFKGPGYYLIGEQMARAHKQALWSSSRGSRIVEMASAAISGSVATVSMSVPVAPLVIDTANVPAQTNHGFNVYDDGGEIGVVGVSITDDGTNSDTATVELTLSRPSSGVDERVEYALVGHSGTRSVEEIPRGNIRDSAPDVSSFDGRPLYNWAVHQRYTLN